VTTADHPLDDLALYALDALDPDEARAVQAHLAGCAACRDELDAHRATLGALTPEEAPPPSVWAGIARDIGAPDTPTPLPVAPPPAGPRPPLSAVPSPPGPPGHDGSGPVPIAPTPPSHLRRSHSRSRRWLAAAAAVAAVVALVAGTVAIVRPEDQTGDLNDLAQAALEAPGSHVITLKTEGGTQAARLVVDGHDGYLLVDDLSTLPQGQEYQLWKLGGPAPVSLGIVGDGGDAVASVGVPADTRQVALSTEPAGGSVAPTGPIVATGQAA